ncbi:MAG: tRNA pseudouridine(54/55) synthase Pus10 [archaeon]
MDENELKKYKLCKFCFERQFEFSKKKPKHEQSGIECWLCENIFDYIDDLVDSIKIDVEFSTFECGSKIPERILEREDELWEKIGAINAVSIKSQLNRILNEKVSKKFGKKVDHLNPDIVFLFDFENKKVDYEIKPIYIYGRYRKLVRGIPQTKWNCRVCWGKGCERCGFSGKLYAESVQELIGEKILEETFGIDTKFHGKGREDRDVRMLGSGRPFIIEIIAPKKRNLDLGLLEKKINEFAKGKVEVSGLRFSNKKEVGLIKTEASEKEYEALVFCEGINEEDCKKIEEFFQNKEIIQKTPRRVLHRRADKARKRKVLFVKTLELGKDFAKIIIRTTSGTYIKELVSGDDGRTKPSFSQVLGRECTVKELDVIEVE